MTTVMSGRVEGRTVEMEPERRGCKRLRRRETVEGKKKGVCEGGERKDDGIKKGKKERDVRGKGRRETNENK